MEKYQKVLLLTAAIICVISVFVMVVALALLGGNQELANFTPPPFDEGAMRGDPDVPEGLGWDELDAQVYKVSVCGVVTIENGKADVWLTNPEYNTVWLKLRILDAYGNTLGQTGLIKPGEYVQTVTFDTLPEVGDAIGLKIMAYEPDTYYSAGSAMLKTTVTGG